MERNALNYADHGTTAPRRNRWTQKSVWVGGLGWGLPTGSCIARAILGPAADGARHVDLLGAADYMVLLIPVGILFGTFAVASGPRRLQALAVLTVQVLGVAICLGLVYLRDGTL